MDPDLQKMLSFIKECITELELNIRMCMEFKGDLSAESDEGERGRFKQQQRSILNWQVKSKELTKIEMRLQQKKIFLKQRNDAEAAVKL